MIYRQMIVAALDGCRDEFVRFREQVTASYSLYADALRQVERGGLDRLVESLAGIDSPGARPTEEFRASSSFVIEFGHSWQNHEEAREWAYETLLGRTTFAADGSQILPSKDFSVPVAAIQVGWFENPHLPDGRYVKDARFTVLSPADIISGAGGDTEFSESMVHRRRYEMEVTAIRDYMLAASARGIDEARPPVVFFDSLLAISFAQMMEEELRKHYVEGIKSLLETSQKTGIPVIGYVDKSAARDLVNMLKEANRLQDAPAINDAALIEPRLGWGARTPLFVCARRGILDFYGEQWDRSIGFIYLKTAADAPPSRLDVPMWVYEKGLLDYVVETVRG
ncbi:MAG TPA: DNA double-strand break repair nuclease NurA, partial [Blastocatellia bacterium]|nr:DNA double-strand break repair nuclease NurA [Blastocatellia bacterium]